MLKGIFAVCLFSARMLSGAEVITTPGGYKSDEGKGVLVISQAELEPTGNLKIEFIAQSANGARVSTYLRVLAGERWACFIESERTAWVYRGGERVISLSPLVGRDEGPVVTNAVTRKFDLRVPEERKFVPQALLDFIEKGK